MFGGGRGGFDPGQLQQMMQQLGIDVTEIEATTVRIETASGETLVFENPEVTKMDAQGEETYQIIGEPKSVATETEAESEASIPDEDVELVIAQTGVDATEAQSALEAADGDLAAAIDQLEQS